MSVHSYAPDEAELRRAHLHAARLELLEYAKMAESVIIYEFLHVCVCWRRHSCHNSALVANHFEQPCRSWLWTYFPPTCTI